MMKQGYSKLEVMKNERYEEKAYIQEMSMYNARINFFKGRGHFHVK